MNAYEIYEAVFDSNRKEWIPESVEEKIDDVIQIADSVFDIELSKEVAARIVNANSSLQEENDKNGEWENNFWHCVKKPLSEVEL